MLVDLDHIDVNFEYQGHWFKVKVILVNSFGMTYLCHLYGHQVKVISKSRSFMSQIVSVLISITKRAVGPST